MIPRTKIVVDTPPYRGEATRVKDLEEGTCFLKEGQLLLKQEHGYCLGLDNFVSYQVRPTERVDEVYRKVHIWVEW